MITVVYLIRHGETDWNGNGRWQGHMDIPLNERGRKQSKLLAKRLADEGVRFDYIYSSDLSRSYQTAWEVGAALGVAVELLPALREIDMGDWSGLTREQIRQQYPIEYALLEQGQDIPRGRKETLAAMRERVINGIEAMVRQHPGETLAFFTHGGPIRAMVCYVFQVPMQQLVAKSSYPPDFPCWRFDNASITILEYDHQQQRWIPKVCNDVSHLEAMEDQNLDPVRIHADDAEGTISW